MKRRTGRVRRFIYHLLIIATLQTMTHSWMGDSWWDIPVARWSASSPFPEDKPASKIKKVRGFLTSSPKNEVHAPGCVMALIDLRQNSLKIHAGQPTTLIGTGFEVGVAAGLSPGS